MEATETTTALAAPKRPRKPKSDLAAALEQVARLKARHTRDRVNTILKQAAGLREAIVSLAGEDTCPLPRESMAAVVFVLEAAAERWQNS